ncbi:hypothetical protein [Sagittula sp. SSi028]
MTHRINPKHSQPRGSISIARPRPTAAAALLLASVLSLPFALLAVVQLLI